MEPIIKPLDKILFYKYLDKATHYIEFGAGGSTYQASIRPNIKSICTVESDIEWIEKLQTNITHPCIHYNYIDIQALPRNLGYPGNSCSPIDMKKYSDVITVPETDLVLIDGRFRVACCLKLIGQINENCIVVFDDFLNRPRYNIILDYFTIIEQTEDNSLVVLQWTVGSVPSLELIEKYEIIPG
jgi:hypothetical protein